MNNYADYDFYQNNYKGSLDICLFSSLIPKASREIDGVVNKELKEADITDKVKFIACEMVDFLKENGKDSSKGKVTSVSVDGVSKSYANKSDKEVRQEKANILNRLPLELISFL